MDLEVSKEYEYDIFQDNQLIIQLFFTFETYSHCKYHDSSKESSLELPLILGSSHGPEITVDIIDRFRGIMRAWR